MVLVLWAAIWLAVLVPTSLSPPSDTVEQLLWVRSLEWGYYKHPPLPTVILRPVVAVFGLGQFAAALLTATIMGTALFIGWLLTSRLLGRRVGWLCLLGSLGIGWYSSRILYYNHDVALLLAFCAAAWFCHRAVETGSRRDWFWLGVSLGAGMLCKYQMGVAALIVVVTFCWSGAWRIRAQRTGLAIAVAISSLMFAPHVIWLVAHDFETFGYAMDSGLEASFGPGRRITHALQFIAQQLGRLALPLVAGAILLFIHRGCKSSGRSMEDARLRPGADFAGTMASHRDDSMAHRDAWSRDRARTFLFLWGILPLLAIVAVGLATGARLQYHWATAFVPLSLAWFASLVDPERWRAVPMRQAAHAAGATQVLALAVAWASAPLGLNLGLAAHLQGRFPAKLLADQVAEQARQALGGPIRVMAGPWYVTGAIALNLPERPVVELNANRSISPWVTDDMARQCGVLWILNPAAPPGDPDTPVRPAPAGAVHPFGHNLVWVVDPPRDRAACDRHGPPALGH